MAINLLAFLILIAVFGALGFLYSILETVTWRRRRGLMYVDCASLLTFFYFCFGKLANAFFFVLVGSSGINMFVYQFSQVPGEVLPSELETRLFLFILAISFIFKTIEILGMIIFQSTADIFLIDWEKPKIEGKGKVSIWRTFFIANEWNEIQTFRKTRYCLQLFAVLLFLEIVGLKRWGMENLEVDDGQSAETSSATASAVPIYRFAVAALVYIVASLVQVLYQVFIHERFFHDTIREFVDLCSVANVSVFILANRHFGYYIHGRSVHGKADTDMLEMDTMLQKEEASLTPNRGLESGTELQTFTFTISTKFRELYDKIYQPIALVRNLSSARRESNNLNSVVYETVRAYDTMRTFLSSFFDHSLLDLEYVIKDRSFLESLFDTEFQETLPATCFFYKDPKYSFTDNIFYGREFSLMVFDVLLFTIIDFNEFNYLLAAIVTYVEGKFLVILRQSLGRSNLAKKTLVDKRFLI